MFKFGIFVIFALLIFIWFGPGLTREYNEDYLRFVAQKGVQEGIFHEVVRYPVFVNTGGEGFEGVEYTFSVDLPDKINGVDIGSIDHVLPLAWEWNTYGLTVTPGAAADGKQLGIAFAVVTGNAKSYIHYDNVQLVPEPATMLIMGLGGLLIRRRK